MTLAEFIALWQGKEGGAERANYTRFLDGLIEVLGLPVVPPGAKGSVTPDYGYEARVAEATPTGTARRGRVDLYKRGCFIIEAKQSHLPPGVEAANADPPEPVVPAPPPPTDLFGNPLPALAVAAPKPKKRAYDRLMEDALAQARGYALALPADHGWPPFLIVCDVGRAFELFFDWTGNGKGYGFFPDQKSYRVTLDDLRDPEIRERFLGIWTDPASIDPRRRAAKVTREIAERLAAVSEHLEKEQRAHLVGRSDWEKSLGIEETALFLMRVLFCMFAEDVELLPKGRFEAFLKDAVDKSDDYWLHGLRDLWSRMNEPNAASRYWSFGDTVVRYFNGNLFANARVFPLQKQFKGELLAAAGHEWKAVEPAIFGTLLEQALTEGERAKLGAHYTPRPYVERLVDATIMEVLRAEWDAARGVVRPSTSLGMSEVLDSSSAPNPCIPSEVEGRTTPPALADVLAFHDRLADTKVLDPACGTGNFLYVAMENLLRLESDVIELARQLGGEVAPRIGPNQFLGIELNPRAAVIAELVQWIGWLRYRLASDPASIREPVLPPLTAINGGRHGGVDALLAADPHTGVVELATPRQAEWPEADFIVGNPPFIGGKDIRSKLGSDYAEALWRAAANIPKSADFVMQWWDRAAALLTAPGARLRRFGFVTTNSVTQSFSRRVIAARLAATVPAGPSTACGGPPPRAGEEPAESSSPLGEGDRAQHGGGGAGLSLVLAIPDHPWTRASKDAAAVRIAMTVAEAGTRDGTLVEIVGEAALDTDTPALQQRRQAGRINADLTVGTDVGAVVPLRANERLCSRGVQLMGAGFIVTPQQAETLGLGRRPGLEAHIRPYRNGRDLLGRSRGVMVIDLFGLGEKEVRERFPEVYQHLLTSVRKGREEQVAKSPTADAKAYLETFWIFGKARSELRSAISGLRRYIATVETSKYRVFQFLPSDVLPDNMLVALASDDAFHHGVLSSQVHCEWALSQGATLEDRPRYSKSRIFDPFPFPDATPAQREAIGALAEELDLTRRLALEENAGLTMTGLYNLVAKLRAGEPLSAADEAAATRARARIVAELHNRIDAAVADAYGWPADLPAAEIVARLVALNAERAAEEAAGHIRWLRPEYQAGT